MMIEQQTALKLNIQEQADLMKQDIIWCNTSLSTVMETDSLFLFFRFSCNAALKENQTRHHL